MNDRDDRVGSRRALLVLLGLSSPLLFMERPAHAQDAAACVNLDALPANQKSMRRSLGFKLDAPDPKKRCGSCTFFTATAGACGKCQLLSGGAVGATNVCDNWTGKS